MPDACKYADVFYGNGETDACFGLAEITEKNSSLTPVRYNKRVFGIYWQEYPS